MFCSLFLFQALPNNIIIIQNCFLFFSFASSRSSHIYLHSDIRVLFRQREPEHPLRTITDGPTKPKYSLMTKRKSNNNNNGREINDAQRAQMENEDSS